MERHMERHDLDLISLVFGLAFTVLGVLFVIGPVGPQVFAWMVPTVAVGVGIALVLNARRAAHRDAAGQNERLGEPLP
jgi:hypothetical protein